MTSNFVDYVKIFIRSGKGGAGSAHLLRVKYNAKAGPDGGDGGRGGKHIAKYAMPYDIEFKEDMPKTLVGKVAYRKLEEEMEQAQPAMA